MLFFVQGEGMKITYAEYSNVGNREINEDSIAAYADQNGGVFLLADGLGGHGRGEVASSAVVSVCMKMYGENPEGFLLETAFERGQEFILRQQEEHTELEDMKTTLVALQIKSDTARWGHIGDSRLYHFKKKKLVGHTLDHSVPQMLVNMGEIKEKDIRGHEDRNRLLRVMGSPWGDRSYTVSDVIKINKPMQFLLCSDGYWENIVEDEMVNCLKKASTPREWLDLMTEQVMKNGYGTDMDNNSAVAVWLERE